MTAGAYYNENDPKAAAWLRELIRQGLIASGDVDERSIEEIAPAEIAGYNQHHFFAGIGAWSFALRLAGWPDDRPVWTGSCPCQPFSAAGKRAGTSDKRHLWPAFEWLIREHRPRTIFGEQVASKDGIAWLDLVSTDLEGQGYAVGPIVLPACGIGAPHIRQRLWFVADADGGNAGPERKQRGGEQRQFEENRQLSFLADPARGGFGEFGSALEPRDVRHADRGGDPSGVMADPSFDGAGKHLGKLSGDEEKYAVGGADSDHSPLLSGPASRMADAPGERCSRPPEGPESSGSGEPGKHGDDDPAGPLNGHWRKADWLLCRDGRWRAVEPGSFPLADGAPARLGRLRGYGNAIVPQVAAEVIRAYLDFKMST